MYTRPTAPLTIGGVVDDAIKLYRESFRSCWPLALLASLVVGAFGIALTFYARNAGLGLAGIAAAMQLYRQPPILAFYLLQLVLSLAFYGALIASQDAVANGSAPLGTAEAIGIGFTRLGRAVMAAILCWVVIAVGLVLLIIPGLYFMIVLCLWLVALYADDAAAMQSLQVSRELTRGYWWRTATILSVAFIIIFVFSMVITFVAGALAAVAVVSHDVGSIQIMVQVVSIIANVFVLPMVPAVLIAIYSDLKLRREGGDLAARVGALP
jgi:hypothetical protein